MESKEIERNRRRTKVGIVISNKMDKTIVVSVQEDKRHPLYGKVFAKNKNFKAHDENNECQIGDKVEITETRPLSKGKYFRLSKIVEKAK